LIQQEENGTLPFNGTPVDIQFHSSLRRLLGTPPIATFTRDLLGWFDWIHVWSVTKTT
jgi:hypothetical protein